MYPHSFDAVNAAPRAFLSKIWDKKTVAAIQNHTGNGESLR